MNPDRTYRTTHLTATERLARLDASILQRNLAARRTRVKAEADQRARLKAANQRPNDFDVRR